MSSSDALSEPVETSVPGSDPVLVSGSGVPDELSTAPVEPVMPSVSDTLVAGMVVVRGIVVVVPVLSSPEEPPPVVLVSSPHATLRHSEANSRVFDSQVRICWE